MKNISTSQKTSLCIIFSLLILTSYMPSSYGIPFKTVYNTVKLCARYPLTTAITSTTLYQLLCYLKQQYNAKRLNNPTDVKKELYLQAQDWHNTLKTSYPTLADSIEKLLQENNEKGLDDAFHYSYIIFVGRRPQYRPDYPHSRPKSIDILHAIDTGKLSSDDVINEFYSLAMS
jgi:predicted restriction endonuclease